MSQDVWISDAEAASQRVSPETVARGREIYLRHGHLTVHNVFPREFIEGVHAAFTSRYAYGSEADLPEGALHVGDRRWMVTMDVAGPAVPPPIYGSSLLLPFIVALLGNGLALGNFTTVLAFPGAEAQHVHRDLPYLFMDDPDSSVMMPPYALTVAIPLVDLTPETGTTALWSGSHHDYTITTQTRGDDPALPYIPRGSAFMMDARLLHGGLANRSAALRPVYYLVYNRGWFRDECNFSHQEPVLISESGLAAVPSGLEPLFRFVKPTPG